MPTSRGRDVPSSIKVTTDEGADGLLLIADRASWASPSESAAVPDVSADSLQVDTRSTSGGQVARFTSSSGATAVAITRGALSLGVGMDANSEHK